MRKQKEVSIENLNFERKSKFFKSLAEPTRLKIIHHLLNEKDCICNIAEVFGKDPSVIFRHILILRDAGIVLTKKKDKFLFCEIKNKKQIQKFLNFVK